MTDLNINELLASMQAVGLRTLVLTDEEPHLPNCPAVDGFGCTCDELIKEKQNGTNDI
jgi:hypothetical protein